jgi:hypothetical protein
MPGATQSCYTGPAGTQGVGVCAAGTQTCDASGKLWGACTGQVLPAAEDCSQPLDEDCDGTINQASAGCICAPGATQPCYTGPAGTENVGTCRGGTQTCATSGKAWGTCVGEVKPTTEDCSTPLDEYCDGSVNEAASGCLCVPASTIPCYTYGSQYQDVGICKSGAQTCAVDGRSYGSCVGDVAPQATEDCSTPTDDNCNGQSNEGCACSPGAVATCYDGPTGTAGVGICHSGTHTCLPSGTGYGACTGQVIPQTETCDLAMLDENCNGQVNESGTNCVCLPNAPGSCYSGPAGTQGVGLCKAGTHTCSADGTAWGACTGEVDPTPELCQSTNDENCDGWDCVLWSKIHGDPTNQGNIGLTVDASGNVYTTGYFTGTLSIGSLPALVSSGGNDIFVAKYDSTGKPIWAQRWGLAADENGQSIAVDADGNLLVTGGFTGSLTFGTTTLAAGTATLGFLLKLSPTGSVLWARKVAVPWPALAVDPSKNAILTGSLNKGVGDNDVWVEKWDTNGTQVWSKTFGDTADQNAAWVATDVNGNIALVGSFAGTLAFGSPALVTAGGTDAFVVKLDPTGTMAWSKRFGDVTTGQGLGRVAFTPTGDVVVAGHYFGSINLGGSTFTSLGSADIVVGKFTSGGAYSWSKSFGDVNVQQLWGVAVEPVSGSVTISGSLWGSVDFGGGALTATGTTSEDVYVARFSSTGTHQWSKRYGDALPQVPYALALGPGGDVHLAGWMQGTVNFGNGVMTSAGAWDAFLVKLGR